MATVVDSFVVELGLDPKNFNQAQKDAVDKFKKLQEAAKQSAKDTEESARKADLFIGKLKGTMVGFATAVLGAASVTEFVKKITQMDAAAGYAARSMNLTTETFSKWVLAAERAGGTTQGMAGFMQGLTSNLQQLLLTGNSGIIPWLNAMQIDLFKTNGRLKSLDELMLEINAGVAKMDPARAAEFIRSLGGDQGVVNFMSQSSEAVQKLLEQQERIGGITKANAEAAQQLTNAWNEMAQSATTLGRKIQTAATPAMIAFLNRWSTIFQELNEGTIVSPDSLVGRALSHSRGLHVGGGRGNAPGAGPEAGAAWQAGQGAATGGLRLKQGASAGPVNVGTLALARALQNDVPGLDRFSALNDAHHAGTSSKHAQGLALDFTLKDPSQSAAVAAQIRAKLASMGVAGTVIDASTPDSPGWTGPHIHVQFASAAAAARFNEQYAGAAGAASASTVDRSSSRSSTTDVHIGKIEVNTQATDAEGIGRDIGGAIRRNTNAAQANFGAN